MRSENSQVPQSELFPSNAGSWHIGYNSFGFSFFHQNSLKIAVVICLMQGVQSQNTFTRLRQYEDRKNVSTDPS